MKTLKQFDYDLWTVEENGKKKYFVRVKATGEESEVSHEVMKILRNEERKMRRDIEKANEFGTVLCIDNFIENEEKNEFLIDECDIQKEYEVKDWEERFTATLTEKQKSVYFFCMKNGGNAMSFANQNKLSRQTVNKMLQIVREKAKKFLKEG